MGQRIVKARAVSEGIEKVSDAGAESWPKNDLAK
jgi:hypothetical protein